MGGCTEYEYHGTASGDVFKLSRFATRPANQ